MYRASGTVPLKPKGQEISIENYGVFNSSKKERKISALDSSGRIKNERHFIMLNSP